MKKTEKRDLETTNEEVREKNEKKSSVLFLSTERQTKMRGLFSWWDPGKHFYA